MCRMLLALLSVHILATAIVFSFPLLPYSCLLANEGIEKKQVTCIEDSVAHNNVYILSLLSTELAPVYKEL